MRMSTFTRIMMSAGLITTAGVWSAHAQEGSKVAFNIGGGVTTPLNPTANYVGLSGNFDVGAGYNLDKKNSIIGEFMWNGLPPNITTLSLPGAPTGSINLYSITANYRRRFDNIGGSPFGVYLIGGGGWYYRHASISKDYIVPPAAVCQPIYTWWGYGCTPDGFVTSVTIASRGVSAGGVSAGGGFTIRLGDSGLRFYVESRYHYAFSRIPSTIIPVTFGFRFN
jgi:Outer membrane protein beta-barrel domain